MEGKRERPYQEDDVEDSVEKIMKIAEDEKDEKEEEERREPAEKESRGSPSREEPKQDGNDDDADGDYDFESLALSVADFTVGGERAGSVVDDVADTLPDSPVQDGTPWWSGGGANGDLDPMDRSIFTQGGEDTQVEIVWENVVIDCQETVKDDDQEEAKAKENWKTLWQPCFNYC